MNLGWQFKIQNPKLVLLGFLSCELLMNFELCIIPVAYPDEFYFLLSICGHWELAVKIPLMPCE
jgi:hypothetical protein